MYKHPHSFNGFVFGWVLHRTNPAKVIWQPPSFNGGEDLRYPSMHYFRHRSGTVLTLILLQSEQALYCWLTDQLQFLILISLKLLMDSSKNRRIHYRNKPG